MSSAKSSKPQKYNALLSTQTDNPDRQPAVYFSAHFAHRQNLVLVAPLGFPELHLTKKALPLDRPDIIPECSINTVRVSVDDAVSFLSAIQRREETPNPTLYHNAVVDHLTDPSLWRGEPGGTWLQSRRMSLRMSFYATWGTITITSGGRYKELQTESTRGRLTVPRSPTRLRRY